MSFPMWLGGPTPGVISVADLIRGSLRLLGVLASEETPKAQESTDALAALNDMLDSWANERLALFATTRTTYTLTPGKNPHTIGLAGADFIDTRPLRINQASLLLQSSPNAELPLSILDDAAWQHTQGKATMGKPVFLWPETKYPLINLWLNPIPVAADTLVLYVWSQLGRFGSTSQSVDMPPGYARAIRYNLAVELAPEYGVSLSPEAVTIAERSFSNVKRVNHKPGYMESDGALLRRGPFNVISGDRG